MSPLRRAGGLGRVTERAPVEGWVQQGPCGAGSLWSQIGGGRPEEEGEEVTSEVPSSCLGLSLSQECVQWSLPGRLWGPEV